MISGRPVDEDAVKYVKPLDRRKNNSMGANDIFAAQDAQQMTKSSGSLLCCYCACSAQESCLTLCGGCKQVRYCSRDCQKKDWPQHKIWCQKSEEEVRAVLTTKGYFHI